ncbi:MAG TPA: caspase family protein [Flavobacteriales bacterium]|nr:caspase family protein [Flavobacteriales bacterium]
MNVKKSTLLFVCVFSINTLYSQVRQFSVNNHASFVAFLMQNDSALYAYNRASNKTFSYEIENEFVQQVKILPSQNKAVLLTGTHNLLVLDLTASKIIAGFNGITGFDLNDSLLFMATLKGEVLKVGISNFSINQRIKLQDQPLCLVALKTNKTELAAAGENGLIYIVDWKKASVLYKATETVGEFESMAFDENNALLFVSVVGGIHVFDSKLKKIEQSIECTEFVSSLKLINGTLFSANEKLNKWSSSTIIIHYNQKNKSFEPTYADLSVTANNNVIYTFNNVKTDLYLNAYTPRGNSKNASAQRLFFDYLPDELKAKDSLVISLEKPKQIQIGKPLMKRHEGKTTDLRESSVYTQTIASVKKPKNQEVEVIPQLGFAAPLKEMLFSSDARYIVTVAESPVVKIWERNSGLLVREIKLPEFNVLKAAVHPQLPLVVIMDRNYTIHLIDLKSLSLIKSFKYNKKTYSYVGDSDSGTEWNYRLFFNKGGTMLSFVDLNTGSWFDYEEGSDLENQFNMLTTDLLTGNVKMIKPSRDLSDNLSYYQATFENYRKYNDTVRSTLIEGYRYEVIKCGTDSSAYCFYNANQEFTSAPIADSVYYLDRELTRMYKPVPGKVDVPLYQKLKKPQYVENNVNIIRKMEEYMLIKDEKTRVYKVINARTEKVLVPNADELGQFIDAGHVFFLNKNELILLRDSLVMDLTAALSTSQYKADGYATLPNTRYLVDTLHQVILVWKNEFNNNFAEINLKDKTVTIKAITKPFIGHAKASIDPAVTYINYRSHFAELDIMNLKATNYYVHPLFETDDKVSYRISTTPSASKFEIDFNYNQRGIVNTSSIENLNFFAHDGFFEFNMKPFESNKFSKYFVDMKSRTLSKAKCMYVGEDCGYQDCDIVCDNSYYIADSLAKNGFFRPRLTANQRSQFENKRQFDRKDGVSGMMRTHTRGNENSYLADYGVVVELDVANLYESFNFDDSIHIVDYDVKYAPRLWNIFQGKIVKQFNTPPVGSFYIHFVAAENKFITYGYDGAVRIYDMNGQVKDPLVTYYCNNENNIFISYDNYYKTTSRAFNLIKFRKGDKLYGIEQFDLKYNRPDILLQRMGNTDTLQIKAYKNAYLKRLKKMGFTEEMLNGKMNLPEVKIENFEMLPEVVSNAEIKLNLALNDDEHNLDRINVYINDVSLFGTAGINLRSENTKELKKELNLVLARGLNKIQVSVLNQAGAESVKETVYITFKTKESVANMYLITIGDSKYSDKRFDLAYAAKDAEDIKEIFGTNQAYSKVFSYSLTNESVTKENIGKLKEVLQKAKRDDVVIITVAGHGVLDKDFNYYLATYDMDFNNPAERGLPYEELEALVDGIAPLKKVIFIDACHSGEVDKEEVEQLAMANTNAGEIKFRATGVGIQKKNLGLKSTSELMSEMFTDLRKGTGATVISSAGGVEYAMESDQWKNGLFTYCLLHGLKDKAADANNDGQIMLSELQQYLRTEVTRLSKGAQQPTSRIENLSMDFRVW